jgi:hypothetical protein
MSPIYNVMAAGRESGDIYIEGWSAAPALYPAALSARWLIRNSCRPDGETRMVNALIPRKRIPRLGLPPDIVFCIHNDSIYQWIWSCR